MVYLNNFLIILTILFSLNSFADQWQVDCGNYCFFSEIQPNCQGVYYNYTATNTKSYSSWSSTQNGCIENNPLTFQTHIIYPNQIPCNCAAKAAPPSRTTAMSSAMRDKLELLRAQVHAWTMCSPDPASNFANIFDPFTFKETNNCQYLRKRNIGRDYLAPHGCYTGLFPWIDRGWHTCGYLGDQLYDCGTACLSGNSDLCYNILDAQDQVTGGWYRNPFLRRHPETYTNQPQSSRDMMLGMLEYWIKSKNKTSATKWLYFVKNNPKVKWTSGLYYHNLCPQRLNIPKPPQLTQEQWDKTIPDDRCAIIPASWGLIYSTLKYIGFSDLELNNIDSSMYSNMVNGELTLNAEISLEAQSAPAIGGNAWQVYDTFDSVFIRYLSKSSSQNQMRQAAATINKRTGYLNPVVQYLEHGGPTEYGAYLIRKYCTATRPNWGQWFLSGNGGQGTNPTGYFIEGRHFFYGAYQFAGGLEQNLGFYILPNGHDCIMALNLYLGNGNFTELQCESGHELINGACRKYAFPNPKLAAIPGLDYKINPWNAKIDYMAIDQTKCPYGGTFNGTSWLPRCEFDSGIPTSALNPNVDAGYVVDPNQSWPGVYYPKVNNACPYGGTSAGANCNIKYYDPPKLLSGVTYWVDPNPSWPGVYYAQINSNCPHGGVKAGPNCLLQGFSSGFLNTTTPYFTRSNQAHPGVYYYPKVVAETKIRNIEIDYLNRSSKLQSVRGSK